MAHEIYRQIIALVLEAGKLARSIGIDNLLQPGLIKEIIIAEHLGHTLITSKRHADACHATDPTVLYEYLSCKEGGTGQLDRMFKEPPEKRAKSLARISRNAKIYFAVFYADEQTKVKVIYELLPEVVVQETERQLAASRNTISHIGFSETWVKQNGVVIYEDR